MAKDKLAFRIHSLSEFAAISPLLAYAATYLYDTSYDRTYGIPKYLFRFDLSQVAVTLSIIFFVPLTLFAFVLLLLGHRKLTETKNKEALVESFLITLLLAGVALILATVFPQDAALVLLLFVGVSAFTSVLRIRREVSIFPRKWLIENDKKQKRSVWLFDEIEKKIGFPAMIIFYIIFVLFIGLPEILGGLAASYNQTFFVADNPHGCIILDAYGATGICGFTDPKNPKQLLPRYSTVDLSNGVKLSREHLGILKGPK